MKGRILSVLALVASFSVFAEPDCVKTGSVCAAPNQTRNISGLSAFRECWEYQDTYQCRSQNMVNDCQPLRDKGCVQLGSSCVERDDAGTCVMYEQQYNCPDKPETYTEKTVCDQSAFCQAGGSGCFDTSAPPDKDFGQAAAMMEAGREAGVYGIDPDKVEVFKGYMEECSIKVLGGSTLKSCCNSSGGGQAYTNNAVLGVSAAAAYSVGKEELRAGSKYVYDALYQSIDPGVMKDGIGSIGSSALSDSAVSAGSSFGSYGFTFSYSAAEGFAFVGFDPYSFALSVAIMLIQEWLSCDSTEQVMSMKRGQNLCVHVATYCAKKTLGACVEKREKHCCFNSKLAKIINRQGRAQLGMPMNSCGGFNQAQLQALDFSQIDLSEFIADIAPKDVPASTLSDRVQQTVNKKVQSYYDQ
jgi:conjugal transfer mating pair stabilization protein TraN